MSTASAPATSSATSVAKSRSRFSVIVCVMVALIFGWLAAHMFYTYRGDQKLLPNPDVAAQVIIDAEAGLGDRLLDNVGDPREITRKNPARIYEVKKSVAEYEALKSALLGVQSNDFQAGASYGSANLEEFRVIKFDPAAGEYEFQLDARVVWQPTGVFVEGGDTVEIEAQGQVCTRAAPCVGPNGQDGLAKTSQVSPDHFPLGDAMCQALVYRFGEGDPRQAGASRVTTAPSGRHELRLMANIRQPFIHEATGGFRVKIRVKKAGAS